MEHSSASLKYVTPARPLLVYYIEFDARELAANHFIFSHDTDLELAPVQHRQVKKFFVRKERDVQVVAINFVRGNYKILAAQATTSEDSESGAEVGNQLSALQHFRSRRQASGAQEKAKAAPFVIATESTLLESDAGVGVFKIKIKLFSESSSHSSNFTQINVVCRRVYNGRPPR
jgi:hypothetical protein